MASLIVISWYLNGISIKEHPEKSIVISLKETSLLELFIEYSFKILKLFFIIDQS